MNGDSTITNNKNTVDEVLQEIEQVLVQAKTYNVEESWVSKYV